MASFVSGITVDDDFARQVFAFLSPLSPPRWGAAPAVISPQRRLAQ